MALNSKPLRPKPVNTAYASTDFSTLATEFQESIIDLQSGKDTDGERFLAAATAFNAGVARLIRKNPRAANDNKPYPGVISSGDFVRGFVPPDYHLDGVFQSRFFYSLTGTTGTGKTAVLLLLAAATAMGFSVGGRDVKKGRVIYMAGENPDDVQMRWIAYGHHLGFDPEDIDVHFVKGTTDVAETLDLIRTDLIALGGADLVIVDTSAAFFFGADENSNTEAGRHARTLRTLTTLPGEPAVIVAAHPTKNASADALLPRGGGAFIAEVDGNLTLSKSDGLVKLHWQGKHRGADFDPVIFRLEGVTAPMLVDTRGRLVPTVLARDMSRGEVVAVAASARRDEDDVLLHLDRDANASLSSIAEDLGWRSEDGSVHKDRARRATDKLKRDKLVVYEARKWKITAGGYDALIGIKADRHREAQAASFAIRASENIVRKSNFRPHEMDDGD
ncbi:AAA family ATPase [Rhizobium sp. NLR22b]|uniref:AAA family ATPase n=1 Tax=Rhizobium sp. NLR22b TaxID=2731115 RepID=UPI001C82E2DC|nr:AAA family ATPase [Rhizobium sp. NLR22b]MBX5239515.1 AAA family ATPase [Rhizobium sp. NLR22b]